MENQNNQQPATQQPVQQQPTSYPQSQAANVAQQTPNQAQNPQYPQNTQPLSTPPPNMPPKKKKGFLKIVLIILVVFAIIGAILVLFRFVSSRIGQTVDSNKPVEITWWGLWENASVIEPIIAQYQNENPNVTINYIRQSNQDYRERLANALARGDGPDIFRLHNTWIPMFRNELSVLPDEVMTQQEYQETFYRVALESALTDDGIVAIPLQVDGLALFINEEIFTTFAKTTPNTWDELIETAEDLTIVDPSTGNITQAGFAMGNTTNIDYWQDILGLLLVQNRANLAEPADQNTYGAMNFYLQFARGENPTWDNAQASSITAFTSGKVAMILAPASVSSDIRSDNPSLDFRVVSVPQLVKFSESDPDISYASFWMEGVSDRSKAQTQSWQFLKFLTQSENLEKLYDNSVRTANVRPEIYPRIDMRNNLLADKYVGGFVKVAPDARFWYLVGNTNDGETGLNTQLSNLYRDQLNDSDLLRNFNFADLSSFGRNVRSLLSQYGLTTPPPPLEE